VEAPVAGSIILAGVLLKLGGYGLLRISSLLLICNSFLVPFFVRVSMWGAFITRIICLRQTDLKSLIAYSSVGHIGLVIGGIISGQF
jgi:NADH-ubiquinone oxidoreductase chain 4